MYVLQFELEADRSQALHPVPSGAVASINTHDTPTFAGFWEDRDTDDREALGHLAPDRAAEDRAARAELRRAVVGFLQDRGWVGPDPSPADVYRALVRHLAAGPARLVLLNIEDLWLETEPQNVPGTSDERPNWCRKLSPQLEDIPGLPLVDAILREVAAARARAPVPEVSSAASAPPPPL
jgi:4-alpha-glucanotransferase